MLVLAMPLMAGIEKPCITVSTVQPDVGSLTNLTMRLFWRVDDGPKVSYPYDIPLDGDTGDDIIWRACVGQAGGVVR